MQVHTQRCSDIEKRALLERQVGDWNHRRCLWKHIEYLVRDRVEQRNQSELDRKRHRDLWRIKKHVAS